MNLDVKEASDSVELLRNRLDWWVKVSTVTGATALDRERAAVVAADIMIHLQDAEQTLDMTRKNRSIVVAIAGGVGIFLVLAFFIATVLFKY